MRTCGAPSNVKVIITMITFSVSVYIFSENVYNNVYGNNMCMKMCMEITWQPVVQPGMTWLTTQWIGFQGVNILTKNAHDNSHQIDSGNYTCKLMAKSSKIQSINWSLHIIQVPMS